jgi:hypothetical protein
MPIQIRKINSSYENTYFPNTKVKFRRKIVKNPTGEIVEGVFADFSPYSLFQLILPKEYWSKTDEEQFKFCLRQLKVHFQSNKLTFEKKLVADHYLLIDNDINTLNGEILDSKAILKKQVNDILKTSSKQKGRFYGYTWHHTENLGEMQLIPDFIHKLVSHIGGKNIWGADR